MITASPNRVILSFFKALSTRDADALKKRYPSLIMEFSPRYPSPEINLVLQQVFSTLLTPQDREFIVNTIPEQRGFDPDLHKNDIEERVLNIADALTDGYFETNPEGAFSAARDAFVLLPNKNGFKDHGAKRILAYAKRFFEQDADATIKAVSIVLENARTESLFEVKSATFLLDHQDFCFEKDPDWTTDTALSIFRRAPTTDLKQRAADALLKTADDRFENNPEKTFHSLWALLRYAEDEPALETRSANKILDFAPRYSQQAPQPSLDAVSYIVRIAAPGSPLKSRAIKVFDEVADVFLEKKPRIATKALWKKLLLAPSGSDQEKSMASDILKSNAVFFKADPSMALEVVSYALDLCSERNAQNDAAALSILEGAPSCFRENSKEAFKAVARVLHYVEPESQLNALAVDTFHALSACSFEKDARRAIASMLNLFETAPHDSPLKGLAGRRVLDFAIAYFKIDPRIAFYTVSNMLARTPPGSTLETSVSNVFDTIVTAFCESDPDRAKQALQNKRRFVDHDSALWKRCDGFLKKLEQPVPPQRKNPFGGNPFPKNSR